MKKLLLLFICIFVAAPALLISRPIDAAQRWRGNWYLRGPSECKEINLDRRGRSSVGVYPKAIVEKKDIDYYLTVQSFGKKYSYKMNDIDKTGYDLELVSVGPNLPLPEGSTSVPAEDAYSAIFRKMVDCQTTMMSGSVKEVQAR